MCGISQLRRHGLTVWLSAAFIVSLGRGAIAQGRTDVVTLGNGDRITGEITKLDRGRLEFKTDDAGTLYFEWDKLVSVTSLTRIFEITTSDGSRYLGGLGPSTPRSITVSAPVPTTLEMARVTHIYQIGRSFWRKLDGSISAGYNYTQSSGVAQFNLNADTKYQRPAFLIRLAGSYTATSTESNPEHDPDDRGYFEGTYARFMTRRWAFTGIGRFETNESLGILLRSEVGAAIGPRFLDTNRAQAWVGGGLIVNHENGVDVEPTKNIEAMLIAHAGYFTYDQPETTIDITLQYFPSLNDPGRHRVQLDASIKRELLKDFIVTLNLYDSYDNRPPNAAFDTNDVGIVFSLGWTY